MGSLSLELVKKKIINPTTPSQYPSRFYAKLPKILQVLNAKFHVLFKTRIDNTGLFADACACTF